MSHDTEPPAGKKHRVIHWNPEAGREQARRRWGIGRVLLWTAGGFIAMLALAAVVTRTIKLVNPDAFASLNGPAPAAQQEDIASSFVTQSRAEDLYAKSDAALAQLRKLPNEHQRQRTDLILLEKEFSTATQVLKAGRFPQAFTLFEALNVKMEEFAESVKAKQEVQTGLDTILARLSGLEIARDLDPESMDDAATAASLARTYNANGSFLLAKRSLETGMAHLDKAQEALSSFVMGNLQKGQLAVQRGEKEVAIAAFNDALRKSPGNELAITGLRRAETSDRVFALITQGGNLEKENRFSEAAESFRRAFELDPLSATAQQGVARNQRLDRDTRFNAAFTAARDAFARRDWDAVFAQAEAAQRVDPANEEVRTMLDSARVESHRDSVARAFARAEAREKEYLWEEARTAYQQTLDLEPAHVEARAGFLRAGEMIRTLQAYNAFVDKAESLAAEGEFQLAISFWNDAMGKKPQYLASNDRIEKLRALLNEQNRMVTITLVSDGDTTVSIPNAANMSPSRFKTKTIEIYPGNYEVVGMRRNYREVRIPLRIRNGTVQTPIEVICTVPARG